jgi:hypothetical protein
VISWDVTAPNCGVNGLAALLHREEWRTHPDGERIRQHLHRLLDSRDATIRMLASMALPLIISKEELAEDLSYRLSHEDDESVIEVLTQIMARHAFADPIGIDLCLRLLAGQPAWSALAGTAEDRTTPPNKRHGEINDVLLQTLLHLYLVRATPFASGLITTWQQTPQHYPATVGRLVTWTRPYLNPPGEANPPEQARAFALLASLTSACRAITTSAQDTLTSGQTMSTGTSQDLESAAWIAHSIAQEIYHASGAFQVPQDRSEPDQRVVSPSFCAHALPLIERLAEIRTAGIAHHLVQTLAFLSRLEPRRAFLAIAKIVTPGSGYEYESLGETEVLDLIDQYLAERRKIILDDSKCLGALRQILETFVAAGSDRAIHRVQDLAELFT